MHVKIASSGAPSTTRVTTAGGQNIEGIVGIRWECPLYDISRAEVTLMFVEIEVDAEARFIGPLGKVVSRIEYADGSFQDFGN